MKTRLFALAVMASAAFFVGCGEIGTSHSEEETAVEMMKVEDMETPTKLAVKIEGMTCPSGCAAAIQKDCGSLAGMGESKVNFEEGIGYFTFDASKLTQEDVLSCIEKTNGGGHYTATVVEDSETEEPAAEEEVEGEVEAMRVVKHEDEAHS
jgi:mercuric ion binding protein